MAMTLDQVDLLARQHAALAREASRNALLIARAAESTPDGFKTVLRSLDTN